MDSKASETEEAILANAVYHRRLVTAIDALEYSPSARGLQIGRIKDLQTQLEKSNKLVVELTKKTKKERKEHEALRDSTSRKLAHKFLGKMEKYEAKASKEEQEYVEALEREMAERDNQATIQRHLDEARQAMTDLDKKERTYESYQTELHALYGRIFDGPSEMFPEDDRLEYELNDAIQRHEKILDTMNAENRAAELLEGAVKEMQSCLENMQEALGYSRYDTGAPGTMIAVMEQGYLRAAQTNATQIETLVNQAMEASPVVQPVGRVNIAGSGVPTDISTNNMFSEISVHSKIKQSTAQVLLATERVKLERDTTFRRAREAALNLTKAGNHVDYCGRELDKFRRAAFENYLAQNTPPPSYNFATSPPSLTASSVPPARSEASNTSTHAPTSSI